MAEVQSCPDVNQLQRLLDGLLTDEEQAGLNDHLAECSACQERLDGLIAGQGLWSDVARNLKSAHAEIEAGTATRYAPRPGEALDHADDDLTLEFLAPSDKPDSLGRLGHYEVLEGIGRGGMGIVLRAFDEKLHRVVAIKVMAPRLAATSPPRKRFLREARAAAQVRHENVVDIHAVEELPIPHLVMEYVPGESLQQRLDRIGPLEVPDVLRIGQQIARGLAAAHAQGLIHRDVKPGNVLLEKGIEERVKITDFGLARAADDASVTQSGVIAGTPLYMAPEQAQGGAIDHRADLFSFGSVLYTMASGRPPFRAPTSLSVLKRVVEDTPRPIQEIIPEVPQWLCALIARLHAKRPEDRYQSAKEVADMLGQRLVGIADIPGAKLDAPVSAAPLQTSKPTKSAIRNPQSAIAWRPWLIAASALLVLLCVLSLTEATGVTQVAATVIRIFTPEGTLVVEVEDPQVQVTIEGDGGLLITGAGTQEVRVRPGKYHVQATKDGRPVATKLVEITRGDRKVVTVTREAPAEATARVPRLLTPAADDLLPNGAKGRPLAFAWEFVWSDVPGAASYEFYMTNAAGSMQPIVQQSSASKRRFEFGQTAGYMRPGPGWHWKVRAKVNDVWGPWSEERPFQVAAPTPFQVSDPGSTVNPFVVLKGNGTTTILGTYRNLAEAVQKSSNGDTIEIRGNGPFAMEPVRLKSSRMIRAGQGSQPVITIVVAGPIASGEPRSLETIAPLVLEGLEFQVAGPDPQRYVVAVAAMGPGSIHIANCRFSRCQLLAQNLSVCQVRNCLVLGGAITLLNSKPSLRAEIENNTAVRADGPPFTFGVGRPEQRLELARNVLIGSSSIGLSAPVQTGDDHARDALRIQASKNIFVSRYCAVHFNVSGPDLAAAWTQGPKAEELLRKVIAWNEDRNLYSAGVPLLSLGHGPQLKAIQPTRSYQTLADWNQFWNAADATSIAGTIRFAGGDIFARQTAAHSQLTPADFHLHADSAGFGAGEDGKDLGPDIDLVGPGEAYERWKKTPDYQQWLKDTGQTKESGDRGQESVGAKSPN